MNPFRRNQPRQAATQSTPSTASLAGSRSEANELADLQQLMDVLLDDTVVSQRTPGVPPVAAQTAVVPAAAAAPERPLVPSQRRPDGSASPSDAGNPGNANIGPQILPAPDPSLMPDYGSGIAPGTQRNGTYRPPMPPAPVGVSTVPPTNATPTGVAPHAVTPHAVTPQVPPGVPSLAKGNRTPGDPYTLPDTLDPHAVAIRGHEQGVTIDMGQGAWDDLLNLLSYRLETAGVALRSTRVELEVGNRSLTETDLDAMRSVMASYGMEPALVRTHAERTFTAALALGIAAQQIATDGSILNEAQRGVTHDSRQGYFIFRGNLRSGQLLKRSEHLLIIGDVNPGAEVVSAGDILVWGRLRGVAHAGANGNSSAVIAALDLDPVQLRIDQTVGAAQAGMSANGPRWGGNRSANRRPELAQLISGQLQVQEWDDIRSGDAMLRLKRS